MKIELPYGQKQIHLDLTGKEKNLTTLEPHRTHVDPVRMALAAPIDSPCLRDLVHPGQHVVIVTSDITRPCPSYLLLPPLMDELSSAGIRDEDVLVVFGLGSHRSQTPDEQAGLLGREITARLRHVDSDPQQTVHIGDTSRGTPVEVYAPVLQADFRIVLGNIEPHYFAGYTGGAKAILPGVCSIQTIRANHALMVDPRVRAGNIVDAPVRLDIEEGAAMVGIDFMLNVLQDNEKNIVAAAAGHPVTAHRWLCKILEAVSMNKIEKPADIVIVSSGGYPKDINMYQAHKALENATLAVKQGGQIIWIAQCAEGLGNKIFEEWMIGSTPQEILDRFKHGFVWGGHIAFAMARILQKARILLISDLPDDLVRSCSLEPYADLESALQTALNRAQADPDIAVIPDGVSVLLKNN